MNMNTNNGFFTKACKELTELNKKLLDELGIKYVVSSAKLGCFKAPNTFKELMKYKDSEVIPISPEGCENTIYGSKEGNYIFRAIHDYLHMKYNLSFSKEDEFKVCQLHLALLEGLGASKDVLALLEIDVKGQVLYYYKHKMFIKNQLNFMWASLMLYRTNGNQVVLPQGIY